MTPNLKLEIDPLPGCPNVKPFRLARNIHPLPSIYRREAPARSPKRSLQSDLRRSDHENFPPQKLEKGSAATYPLSPIPCPQPPIPTFVFRPFRFPRFPTSL